MLVVFKQLWAVSLKLLTVAVAQNGGILLGDLLGGHFPNPAALPSLQAVWIS